MSNPLLLILPIFAVMAAGCAAPIPVEFATTCDKAHDKKTVEVTGFLNNSGSAMCSKTGNEPMRCPVDFVAEMANPKAPLRAFIDKGDGSNEINAAGSEGLKIRDDKGVFVEKGTKVKITAKVKRLDAAGSDSCYLTVKKIERL